MNYPRPCGCKGCRTCVKCEKEFGIEKKPFIEIFQEQNTYIFCPDCNKLFKGWDCTDYQIGAGHLNHPVDEIGISFSGVYVERDFLSVDEELRLMKGIDEMPWDISQSGRRKQNFGPKTNFKKQKLAIGKFHGFPEFSKFVQTKFNTIPLLKNFQTIEQCSLEYEPKNGASIDPHIDDCWIWGERVVTVNCLTDSVLTLNVYLGDRGRYNLPLVKTYQSQLISDLLSEEELKNKFHNIIIRIPMPNRSLIVLYGMARYQWEHCVLRDDINERRVCVAYREFTPLYLSATDDDDDDRTKECRDGVYVDEGKPVLEKAKDFFNHKINDMIW